MSEHKVIRKIVRVRAYTRIHRGKAISVRSYVRRSRGHVVDQVDEFVKNWEGKSAGRVGWCVELVGKAVPDIGSTSTWHAGTKISGFSKPPLKKGTVIATFNKDGEYTNTPGESHAAIFLQYGKKDGKAGIWVFDQYTKGNGKGKPRTRIMAQRNFYPFTIGNTKPKYLAAETFSVVRKQR